jgi:EAL domain-containing protein (putative c-di-GMP-specific phosphodiesterase class I)
MIGCPVGQGFYFSRPLRAREFSELVAGHGRLARDTRSACAASR